MGPHSNHHSMTRELHIGLTLQDMMARKLRNRVIRESLPFPWNHFDSCLILSHFDSCFDPFPLPFPLVGGELIDGGLDVEGAADGVDVPKRPRQHSMHWQSLGPFIISIMEELLEEPFPFPLPLPMHIVML